MTGKVFHDSTNIYQDQAKVLFDYYKAAAEKIISDEKAVEKAKEDLTQQISKAEADITTAKKLKPIFFIVAAACAVAGIVCLMIQPTLGIILFAGAVAALILALLKIASIKKDQKTIEQCQTGLTEADERYKNIRRDYAVEKIGVAYVPVATRVPFEGKSFLVDHTNTVDDKNFHLTLLHQPQEFQKSVMELQKTMENMPVVESNELPEEVNTSDYSLSVQNMTLHDYVGSIDRNVRTVSYLLSDSEQVSVEMPVIIPHSQEAEFIGEYATTETGDKPVLEVFDTALEDKLNRFTEMNAAKDQFATASESGDSVDYLKKLMSQMAESVSILSKTKNSGSSRLMNYTSGILANVLKAGYNQYSPVLEAEEIERIRTTNFDYNTDVNDYEPFHLKKSSGVKYDLFSGNWAAEDGTRTIRPFGMHQIDEEIIQPVIANLMAENRVERLRIYSDIEDQKRDYLDRWSSEIGSYYRDNRAACDELINRMRDTYADYMSAYNMYKSLQETADTMKKSNSLKDSEVKELDSETEMIAGFEAQAKACNDKQAEFADYMDRIQDKISQMTEDFAHIEYYEGSLRDKVSHDTAVAMANILNLSDRRKQLLGISPYVASYSELPPEPKTSDLMYGHASIDLEEQVKEQLNEIASCEQQGNA